MKIVFARTDGGCTIRTLAEDARLKGEYDEQFAQRIAKRHQRPHFVGYRIVNDAEVPADRTFRNAWKADLTVDMPKAREIHRENLRQRRAPILAALDIDYQRADERGDTAEKQRIAARKQALRDVTVDPAIAAAQTPEELKVAAIRPGVFEAA